MIGSCHLVPSGRALRSTRCSTRQFFGCSRLVRWLPAESSAASAGAASNAATTCAELPGALPGAGVCVRSAGRRQRNARRCHRRLYTGSGATHSAVVRVFVRTDSTESPTALTTPFGRCQWHPFELQAKHFLLPSKGEGSKTPGRAGPVPGPESAQPMRSHITMKVSTQPPG